MATPSMGTMNHCYTKNSSINLICNEYLSPPCKDLQTYWEIMNDKMQGHRFHKATNIISICGDSVFLSPFHLISLEFDVEYLRLYIVQTFYNSIM